MAATWGGKTKRRGGEEEEEGKWQFEELGQFPPLPATSTHTKILGKTLPGTENNDRGGDTVFYETVPNYCSSFKKQSLLRLRTFGPIFLECCNYGGRSNLSWKYGQTRT